MLHDPKRDIPQLLTAERVAMWLETQPPEKEYSYFNNCNCLLAQYLIDYGYQNVFITYESAVIDGTVHAFPDTKFNNIMWPESRGGSTFGEALKRAKAIIAEQKELV